MTNVESIVGTDSWRLRLPKVAALCRYRQQSYRYRQKWDRGTECSKNVRHVVIILKTETASVFFLDFDPRDNVQYWDIKVVYENGKEDYWIGLDFYRIYSLTIRPGGAASIEMI